MTAYRAERRYFQGFKSTVPDEAVAEYCDAINTLLNLYNTTIYENRFIVGGAVEVFTLALLRSGGISVESYGDEAQKGDLILPGNNLLSVKSSFTHNSNIKLVNTMGNAKTTWETATLFVLSDIGIVYGDPDMVNPEHLRYVGDGLELKRQAVKELAQHDQYKVHVPLMYKPPKERTGLSQKASTAVAKDILRNRDARNLIRQYPVE